MKKRICRICLVLFGAMIIVDFLAKFVLKDNLRNLVKAYWCRQVIRNQELLSCMKKPCFSWIWYDYAYYCGFYYYDNEEPMEVHDLSSRKRCQSIKPSLEKIKGYAREDEKKAFKAMIKILKEV